MKQEKLSKNYIYNSVYELLLILVPFITTPYVSRILGADMIGRVSFSQSISSYFVLFSAVGTSIYARRQIAVVRDDKRELSESFWSIFVIRLTGVTIALLLYLTFTMGCMEHKLIYLCCSLDIISVLFDISWFFQGLELYGKITKINGFSKILGVVFIFIFVHNKTDVILYIIGSSGFSLLGNTFLWTLVKNKIYWKVKLNPAELKKHLKFSVKLLLPQISIQVYTVLDKTMIGIITKSETENGYYEQAQKICRALLTLTTAPGLVIIPKVAYLWGNNKREKIAVLIHRNFQLLFAMSLPIISGVLVLADMFVPLYFGTGYENVTLLMRILVFLTFVAGISSILGSQYLIPTQREHIYTHAVIISAISNVALNLILIRHFASKGAVIASIAAEVIGMLYQVLYLRKEINYQSLLPVFLKYLGLSIFMGAAVKILRLFFLTGNSILDFILLVAVGCSIYAAGLFLSKDDILKKEFWNKE